MDLTNIPTDYTLLGEEEKKDEQEKETPAAPSAEVKPNEDSPSQEGTNTPDEDNVPFHKHPRWKEMYEENKSLREKLQDLDSFREEMKSRATESEAKTVPGWFVELYGENEAAWTKYQEHDKQRTEEIKASIRKEDSDRAEKVKADSARWENWVDENLSRLKDEGKSFEKNDFLKTLLDYKPTDDKGNIDFDKGYRIYEAMKPQVKSEEKKKAAAKVSVEESSAPSQTRVLSAKDLRNKSFTDLY